MIDAPPREIPGCKLIHLDQRTPEWHAWREGKDLPDGKPRITGTLAAIIAGDSVTGKTAHQAWMEMTGRKQKEEPSPYLRKLFKHGELMEQRAKEVYQRITGNRIFDICVEHPENPWAAASLDGLEFDGSVLQEFKAPISQRVHTMAKRQIVPSYYFPQVQWELFCTPSAVEAHYFSYFEEDEEGQTEALVIVPRDPVYQAWLMRECAEFRMCLIEDRPPASEQWLRAARTYKQAKDDAAEANHRLKAATKALTDMIPEGKASFDGGGVQATRYFSGTVVDWKKALKDEEFKDDEITVAEDASRDKGEIDYDRLFESLNIVGDARTQLEDASRLPGPIDYKKVAKSLGLTPSEIKVLEAKYKGGGDPRFRVTITSDYVPLVTPEATPGGPPPKPRAAVLSLPASTAGDAESEDELQGW